MGRRGVVAYFLKEADPWLIAHAKDNNYVIVTHERPSQSTTKIKIPDICNGLGVKWINTFEMLRDENAKFIL